MHGNVGGVVVADRAFLVVRTLRQEPVVALRTPCVPVVPRCRSRADAIGVRFLRACRDRLGRHELPRGIAILEVLACRHREPRTPAPASVIEVLLVASKPAEIVVEGAVLHHQHHDRVDRALLRRPRQQWVSLPRRTRGTCGPGPQERRPQRGNTRDERTSATELPPGHPLRHCHQDARSLSSSWFRRTHCRCGLVSRRDSE